MQIGNLEEAKALLAHQPLPPDGEWDDDLVEAVASLRRYLQAHTDDSLLELLLQSTGEWGGNGQYQLFPRVLMEHSRERVAAALRVALASPRASVRYWSAQYASEGYAGELLDCLERLLSDPDEGVREVTITAVESAGTSRALALLRGRSEVEPSPEVRTAIAEAIASLEVALSGR